jgi:cyclic pyranopterin phosphate synthase
MPIDSSGRTIDYIRISVTDRCNLRCWYCMPSEGVPSQVHGEILRFEEIMAFLRVAIPAGIRKVRITGGEPLVRKGLVSLIRHIASLPDLMDLGLTTNATLLAEHAPALREAGLGRLNIGLPSLDPHRFHELTRGGNLSAALAGLEMALKLGFSPIKINVVLLRGINDHLQPYIDLIHRLPVEVRFIEYMPIGPQSPDGYFMAAAELRQKLESFGPFETVENQTRNGPGKQGLRPVGAQGSIAIIAPMTEHFCDQCNRLRLTADGHLRLCLLGEKEIDLKPALRPAPDPIHIKALLDQAIAIKPACMPENAKAFGRRMSQIGG